jgi:D-3-phosphoglycerate dehydrogenase
MHPNKVLFIDSVHEVLQQDLSQAGYECYLDESCTPDSVPLPKDEIVGIVVRSRWVLNATTIEYFPSLKWIARSGSGLENIDVMYAHSMNIKVYSSPEGNADAVGEHVLAMTLAMTRKLISANQSVKQREWLREYHRGIEIKERIFGIIGLGHMGSSVAKKLSGYGCKVMAHDLYLKTTPLPEVELVDLPTFFEKVDFVSLHLPLSTETKYYADQPFFDSFAKPIYFINTARGQHCKTANLLSAIEQGKVIGAALDVLEFESSQLKVQEENSETYHQLIAEPKVLLTPHIAGWTVESYFKLSKVLADKILKDQS